MRIELILSIIVLDVAYMMYRVFQWIDVSMQPYSPRYKSPLIIVALYYVFEGGYVLCFVGFSSVAPNFLPQASFL